MQIYILKSVVGKKINEDKSKQKMGAFYLFAYCVLQIVEAPLIVPQKKGTEPRKSKK